MVFYVFVVGNVVYEYEKDHWDSQDTQDTYLTKIFIVSDTSPPDRYYI